MATKDEDCLRSWALWRPGVIIPGFKHSFRFRGKIPNTGPRICNLCGCIEVKPASKVIKPKSIPRKPALSRMVCIGCGLGQKAKAGAVCVECGGKLMLEV